MRQNDRADLNDMAHDLGLTEPTKHAILSYPLPDQSAQRLKTRSLHLPPKPTTQR